MSPFKIAKNRFLYLAAKKRKIALICHRKPDCDTIGSALALKAVLEQKKEKSISIFCIDEVPQNMLFLPEVGSLKKLSAFTSSEWELVVALDCGDFKQTGFPEIEIERKDLPLLVNIDHHGNDLFGDINIVNADASATAELIFELASEGGYLISRDSATCLFSGILQDTDNFKNPNTTIDTFKTTSALLAKGVNIKKVGASLNYNRSMNSLKVWGRILERAKMHRDLNVVTTYITNNEIDEFGTCHEDIEGIANFLNSMPDVKAACVLMENKNGEIKGSLRTLSDDIDVSRLASFLGGGGHRRAAGFSVQGKIDTIEGRLAIV